MTIADCAAGREKTANLEAINDRAFIILFVGMLVLEATTIRLCDMNCYPIPPPWVHPSWKHNKWSSPSHLPCTCELEGKSRRQIWLVRWLRWMYVLTLGFCRLLPRRVMALSIWGKANSSFSWVEGVIVAREDVPEKWPHPLPWFAMTSMICHLPFGHYIQSVTIVLFFFL